MQSSYTWSRTIDTTQASTFFSDATNGTSAFPEFAPATKGPADWDTRTIGYPRDLGCALGRISRPRRRAARQLAAVRDRRPAERAAVDRLCAEQPLALAVVAVAGARDWPRSSGPCLRQDARERGARPAGSMVRSGGVPAAAGRHARQQRARRVPRPGPEDRRSLRGEVGRLARLVTDELRVEVFNVLNRAISAPGRSRVHRRRRQRQPQHRSPIRTRSPSARQMQLGSASGSTNSRRSTQSPASPQRTRSPRKPNQT